MVKSQNHGLSAKLSTMDGGAGRCPAIDECPGLTSASAEDRRVQEDKKRRRAGEVLSERQESLLAAARQRAKRADWLLALNSTDSPLRGITEASYLDLADWIGRQIRAGKRGKIPDHILPILQELDIHTERWVKTVEKYGSLFHRLVA